MSDKPAGPMDVLLAGVEWEPLPHPAEPDPEGLPYATHQGDLNIGGTTLRVYQLSNGQRVVDAAAVHKFFDGA